MKCIAFVSMVCSVVLAGGCVSHHYRSEGDTLVFYLKKPDVKQAVFVCSLDDFEPRQAKHLDGQWVVFLPPGKSFRYYYVLDGKIFLPPCRMKEKDDFGSENCIFDPVQERL